MRRIWASPYTLALGGLIALFSTTIRSAAAGQVVTDAIRQWAHQAVKQEASLALKPTANTVAVLYFRNQTRKPELDFLQKGMAVMLMTDLAKLPDVQVVERTQLQALVQELQLGASGLVDMQTAPRIGRLLGARYLVGGALDTAPADTIRVDSDVLNVPRNGILGAPTSNGPLEALLHMEKEILFDIVRLLRLELTEAQKKELQKPFTTNIRALMFLVRGIDNGDRGAYQQAAQSYQEALNLDPGLAPARSAIVELQALGLISALPGTNALLYHLRDQVSVNRGPIPGQMIKRRLSEPASVQGPASSPAADVRVQW
jgi:TolB-like protein